jgi:hypothetical protein
MKRLILALALLLPASAASAQPASPAPAQPTEAIRCPGDTTVEMRYCAGLLWEESSGRLQRRLPPPLLRRWQDTTRAVCAHAYAPFREGTIFPQLVVGCDDRLNRALLKEFEPINNQGDPERMP